MTDTTKTDDAKTDDKKPEGKASKIAKSAAETAAAPEWQHPDYNGPIDAEKAAWRNKHLKRLDDGHTTKPATKAEATK